MFGPSADELPRPFQALLSIAHRLENWLGTRTALLFMLLYGLGFSCGQMTWFVPDATRRDCLIVTVLLVLWLSLDLPLVIRLIQNKGGEDSCVLQASVHQHMAPLPLRPLISLWWIIHFGVAFYFASMMRFMFDKTFNVVAAEGMTFVLASSLGFCANAFLMMAICAMTRSQRIRMFFWRTRLATDVCVAITGVVLTRIPGIRW